uniref:G-patch domain-containing protein n=1 Tax=Arcella intermedia TaxID=1963864 RepID=A0A6B2L9G7_9EUKA
MAPRVARMSARGIKETSLANAQKKATKTPNLPSAPAAGGPQVNNILHENEANPVDSKGTNLTQALNAMKDPYDPAEPNDYQEFCRERMRKLHEKERSLLESQTLAAKEKDPKARNTQPNANFNGVPGMSPIAEKMMKKMGWKGKGHGLGRQEQGMTTPLIAQKHGAGAQGIIIHADSNKQQPPPPPPAAPAAPEMKGSNVIVLRNMVGPGEVDDMLCGETTRECMKYGQVLACEVWEDPTGQLPSNEAVRLFVKFDKQEQALQALADLDGRFFGGRNVKADFYLREKFDKMEFNEPI